jgi:hypothetical protein
MKNGRRMGAPPKPYEPPDTPAGKVNVTDPDSRNVKTPRGYMQDYNVQAAVDEQQIVIAAEVTIDSPHFGHLDPMVKAVEAELIAAGLTDAPEVIVADAGYWHQVQMQAVVDRGIQVLVPPDAGKRKTPRPGWDGGAYAFMRSVLATDHGSALYGKRQGMIEPVFANTKFICPHRPLPAPRQISSTPRMAPDHRNSQPSEAPQAPDRPHGRLTRQRGVRTVT